MCGLKQEMCQASSDSVILICIANLPMSLIGLSSSTFHFKSTPSPPILTTWLAIGSHMELSRRESNAFKLRIIKPLHHKFMANVVIEWNYTTGKPV